MLMSGGTQQEISRYKPPVIRRYSVLLSFRPEDKFIDARRRMGKH